MWTDWCAISRYEPGRSAHWAMAWVDVEPCATSSATNFASSATPLVHTTKDEDPSSNVPYIQAQSSNLRTREPTRRPTRVPTRRPRGRETREPTDVYVYSFGALQDKDDKPVCEEKYLPDKKYETDDVVSSKGDNYKCRLGPWCGEMAAFKPGKGSMAVLVWEDLGPCRRGKKGGGGDGDGGSSIAGSSGSGGATIDLGTKIEDSITPSANTPTKRPASNSNPRPTPKPKAPASNPNPRPKPKPKAPASNPNPRPKPKPKAPASNPNPRPKPKPGTSANVVDTVAKDEAPSAVPGGEPPCPYPWEEGRPYTEGETVGFRGRMYACLGYPYTGWCGLDAAYSPGVGSQWTSAWEVVGDCTGGGTRQPTGKPTRRPTRRPVEPSPAGQGDAAAGALVNDKNTIRRVYDILDSKRDEIDGKLFLYQGSEPSTVYRYEGFIAGLKVMVEHQMAGLSYYLGDDSENGHLYGLVNIAAFIGQSMKETIQYGLPLPGTSAAHGVQGGPRHVDHGRDARQVVSSSKRGRDFRSRVQRRSSVIAFSDASWIFHAHGDAQRCTNSHYLFDPSPLSTGTERPVRSSAAPRPSTPTSGYGTTRTTATTSGRTRRSTAPRTRARRRDGTTIRSRSRTPRDGPTSRGAAGGGGVVIQTTGIWGKRAADEGRESRYPTIDFCKDPEVICHSEEFKELKWIAGFFYWIESLQAYNERGWDYQTELHKFVDEGMGDHSFINAVSGIVNRGCHDPPCGTGAVDGTHERAGNFNKVLDILTG
ncbi:hypothetical protein THAOC_23949 [Thalassiosira oceanica]|uniref:Chitin-binding type-3 domain-containing protein n=1 Tax=Thalassiosira oceanica TaxID=159749 RepID=K0S5Q3_THAOC|nr:hypothetical protein THAOC_23949 [Thalassiosira oceanica]|eukprot:EJK56211.1 hypothetical protein THAOC_23949 [Thalassiosira oceanica]